MKITKRQAYVLQNLSRIIFIQGMHKKRPTLDGKDCGSQLTSLGAKKIIRWNGQGRPVKIAGPDGIMDPAECLSGQAAAG